MLEDKEYHPELLPRRGEWLAWLTSIGLLVGLYFADRRLGDMALPYWIFAGLLIFFAMSISLGNWMDRQSSIRVGADGMAFKNGLRSVRLAWSEIQNVMVMPTRLGKRVEVMGSQAHFSFKTMWSSGITGQDMRTGYSDGQKILEIIIRESGLSQRSERDGMLYYARP
jgi:hypothetical protein